MVTYPKDWEIVKIDDIFHVFAGGDVKRQYFSEYRTSQFPYEICSNGIENKGVYGYTSYPVYEGNSLTVTARGTIGQAYYRENPFDAIIRLLVLSPKSDDVKPKFYEYFINRYVQFERENTGVPQLTAPKIKVKNVPFPSGKEQMRIVSTLEKFDTHIDNLTALIEKKKSIRDGALADLMSGRTRLDGFSGEWEEKTLGECGRFISGSGFPLPYQGNKSGKYPFYKVSDFNNVGNEYNLQMSNNYVSEVVADKLNCNIVPRESIIFAKIGAAIYLERKRITSCDCCIDNNMMAFSVNDDMCPQYICFVLQGIPLSDYSCTTALPSLGAKVLGKIKIYTPKFNEQKAIADILTSMDTEIQNLEIEREKFMQIREGAMDDLLTGRVRLPM